jgi:hypothetical protein
LSRSERKKFFLFIAEGVENFYGHVFPNLLLLSIVTCLALKFLSPACESGRKSITKSV